MKNHKLFLGLVVLTGLGACTSTQQKLSSALDSFVVDDSYLVQDRGSFALAKDWAGDLYMEKRLGRNWTDFSAQVWSGRGTSGVAPQSFVAPKVLPDNHLLVTAIGEGLFSVNANTGSVAWKLNTGLGAASEPFVLAPYVYAAFLDGSVKKIDLASGDVLWSHKMNVESMGGVTVGRGLVFVTATDNSVWAIDEKTGAPVWTYRRPSTSASVFWSLKGASTPVLTAGNNLVAGFSDGSLVALGPITGNVVWEKTLESSRSKLFRDFDLGPVLSADRKTFYIAQVDGDLLAIDAVSGAVKWKKSLDVASTPVLDEQRKQLWVGSSTGYMMRVSTLDGQLLSRLPFGSKGILSRVTPLDEQTVIATWTKGGWSMHKRGSGEMFWEASAQLNSLAPVTRVKAMQVALLSTRNRLHLFDFKSLKPEVTSTISTTKK